MTEPQQNSTPTYRKPTLCLDFDGVLHSYTSGWQGASTIPDPPVPGAFEFLRDASQYFTIAIHSSRSHQDGGIDAMSAWLNQWAVASGISEAEWSEWGAKIQFPLEKPPAHVTLDDRAITFTGSWPDPSGLLEFRPWNKR